jgi:DNA-directed RNA polymerase specialized sigma24 family protein
LGGIRGAGGLALTSEEFESLLRVLDADRAAAGERYESLRRRLLILFAARHCGGDTAALADDTLDRVARRVHQGIPLETTIEAFVFGVARNVARERLKLPREVEIEPTRLVAVVVPAQDSGAQDCLEECLQELQPRPRDWAIRFYTGSGGAKIAARKRLAAELGIDLNALRVRMFRIRTKLEECVDRCLSKSNDFGKGTID